MRIGIMGGTFDPIHHGHLVIAEEARYLFHLAGVIFVPAGTPPHKPFFKAAPAHHRLAMVELAVANNPFFEVSPVEIERAGPSYTVDTLEHFHRVIPGEKELFFITGADAIIQILTWKNLDRVVELCTFIAATRPGFTLAELKGEIARLPENFQKKIYPVEIPGLAISSTDLRRRIREGRPIKYLVPEKVEEYIYRHGLYGRNKGE